MLRNYSVNVAKMHVAEIVLRSHERNDGLLSDFCDGDLFACHPLFSLHSSALQIILYYDDMEICNPLGISDRGAPITDTDSRSDISILF
uniref:Uncharacterized protein n=1 Tax=Amphimedon queenslandica TaxID=400682 RepID=A0A1X7UZQ4_AMPQE